MASPVKIPSTPQFDSSKDFIRWLEKIESENRGATELIIDNAKYKIADLKNSNNRFHKAFMDAAMHPKNLSTKGLGELSDAAKKAHLELSQLKEEITKLKEQLNKNPEMAKEKKTEINAKLQVLQNKFKSIAKNQRANLRALVLHNKKKGLTADMFKLANAKVPKNLSQPGDATKAQVTAKSSSNPKAQQAQQQGGANKSMAGAKATKAGGLGNFGPGWGANTMTGPKFSSAAYAQSLMMENNIMDAWDGITNNQNRGQKLMQLLHYYMQMAMSGDLSAMYNMMKAVLYIISKDKALQQIHMANQLIKLQDDSRKATDQLLNFQQSSEDPGNTEFTKMLQQTKAQTDSIATSQKLIAQMMEEMAQIVETLTNVTKGALDANGRVLRTVSRMA